MPSRNQFLSGLRPLTKLPEGVDDGCSICTEEFIGPVELPCKHLYCKSCITEWVDRGPAGANRVEVVVRAMQHSRLMTEDGFDIYDHDIVFTRAAVHGAAASASQYLILEQHPVQTETLLIDLRILGPHLIAMGNLLARGYARAMGRPYSGYQRRERKLIVSRLYTLFVPMDRQLRHNDLMDCMIPEFRAQIRESLRQELIDTDSGHFFERDVSMESPSGDLDVLLNYVLYQCAKAYSDREARRAALRRARDDALDAETAIGGWTVRWFRQTVFRGV